MMYGMFGMMYVCLFPSVPPGCWGIEEEIFHVTPVNYLPQKTADAVNGLQEAAEWLLLNFLFFQVVFFFKVLLQQKNV